ncbi:MAG: PilZ domain-containing protein [Thermoguttaceae bacterium]|jgi:hypothetical protein|nr:PilZ domain-containing protein [Thermoguttaceae bacterium]
MADVLTTEEFNDLSWMLLEEEDRPDRRTSPREAYPVVQSIAPYDGKHMPRPEAFCPIRCCDLSTGGFSFLLPKPPEFRRLVVALGTPSGILYLDAEVAHCSPYPRPTGDFVVGCRFLRKLT